MTQPGQFRIWPRLSLRGWTILILWLVIFVAVLVTVALIAFGIFLFLLPAFLILTLLYYLFPSRFRAPSRQRQDPTIIDGEFRVVEPRAVDQKPPAEGA
jgi:membrane protein implicated in regulation of membrane protease activity